MKKIRIKFDFSHGPIWKDKYNVITGEWSTGIEVVDNDKILLALDEEASKVYSSLYSFDEEGVLRFDTQAYEMKKSILLSLIKNIVLRLNSLSDGSFEIIDEESKKHI